MLKVLPLLLSITLTYHISAENTAFGSISYNTGFEGHLYNLKSTQEGEATEVRDKGSFYEAFKDLIKKKFSDKALSNYQIIDEITLVLAEAPGGTLSGKLMVQQEGFRYDEDSYDDPELHPFLCGELERDEMKELKKQFETRKIPTFKFKTF